MYKAYTFSYKRFGNFYHVESPTREDAEARYSWYSEKGLLPSDIQCVMLKERSDFSSDAAYKRWRKLNKDRIACILRKKKELAVLESDGPINWKD